MIIINADDWGRSPAETDAALACYKAERISSVTAMVFMADSERAAVIATSERMDVGLHLNLNEQFTNPCCSNQSTADHERVVRYLRRSKFCQLVYNPALRGVFSRVFRAQYDEFVRLYGHPPTHIDGHQHLHLCSNMLIEAVIPKGERVRRNFSFWPGEKSVWNRAYRRFVDEWLTRRYRTTDYFFALSQNLLPTRWSRLSQLARKAVVELMAHPAVPEEFAVLRSDEFHRFLQGLELKTYAGV